jgi:hypothetical protein
LGFYLSLRFGAFFKMAPNPPVSGSPKGRRAFFKIAVRHGRVRYRRYQPGLAKPPLTPPNRSYLTQAKVTTKGLAPFGQVWFGAFFKIAPYLTSKRRLKLETRPNLANQRA